MRHAREHYSFKVGDRVRIIRSNGSIGDTTYEISRINGFACMIREAGLAPNGKPYAEQRSDLSMLVSATFGRGASYSEKQKMLSYWSTPNRTTMVKVRDIAHALQVIKQSGIEQSLKPIAYFESSGKPVSL